MIKKTLKRLNKYNFEVRHIVFLFSILIFFEIIVFLVFKSSLNEFVRDTREWYLQYTSNKMANTSVSSLEMLVETVRLNKNISEDERRKTIQKFDILLNQQIIEKDVEEICLFAKKGSRFFVVDDGEVIFNRYILKKNFIPPPSSEHRYAEKLLDSIKTEVIKLENQVTLIDEREAFNSFIPFVPDGVFSGILYIRSKPNFSSITSQFINNYDIIAFTFSLIILVGLFFMYLISSYTVRTRDKIRKDLFEEKEIHLQEKIEHEKESVFTRRIYHAHHKAEKVMGFITSDIRKISGNDEIKERVLKYSNFISRIIYDMKWYEPQISTIRNPIFNTDINKVILFLVDNLFNRLSISSTTFSIKTEFDKNFPVIHVNEFVIWEILEPLVQNSLVHNKEKKTEIKIRTSFDQSAGNGKIYISDNGRGIAEELLQEADGRKKIFHEQTSTKSRMQKNFGYGCFIAYNMTKRCGWGIDVKNLPDGGCEFAIEVLIPKS